MTVLRSNRWLIARRCCQLGVLGLFLLGPWFGIWIVKGNLSASMTLDVLPLADPFVLSQTLFAGHLPETTVLVGALIVGVFYLLVGGRTYCAWVCPVNIVTDAAFWVRTRLRLTGSVRINRSSRYWLLAAALLTSAATGVAAWELINPVSILHRGIIFGMAAGWVLILGVFLFDVAVKKHGWCGHVCPMGAFYSLLAVVTPLRVSAVNRQSCNDCMDCYRVCPEPQVIKPALKGAAKGNPPTILAPACTNCGRCLDVCSENVFRFTNRFAGHSDTAILKELET